MTTRGLFTAAALTVAAPMGGLGIMWLTAPSKIVELSFATGGAGANAAELTLQSLRKVGNIYTVSYHGDYEERLRWFSDEHLKLAGLKAPPSCRRTIR